MNLDLRDLMASRAESVDPPLINPLAVVADGERLLRSRRRLTAAGAALALAVTVGTATVVLDRGDERLTPSGPIEWTPGTRPLSWGEGQTIHLGEREVDTGIDFLSLDVTDDGAAFTTLDGGIWFTDGTSNEQVGATLGGNPDDSGGGIGWPAGRPADWVVNDNAGSLLAWLEYPAGPGGPPELVVFDSARRTDVARTTVELGSRHGTQVAAVAGRQVFLYLDHGSTLLRYDVDSRTLDQVRPAGLEAARRGAPRALVVGASAPQDGRVIPNDDLYGAIPVVDSRLDGLFDAQTGERLDLRMPSGFQTEPLTVSFIQWLDNDRFTVVTSLSGGDLLLCQISAGRCTAPTEPASWQRLQSTLMDGPLLPGHGGIGAEVAMGRALRAQD